VNGLQWWHILIVVLVALVLFGGKRLPDAARGLGRSLRILKAEVGAMSDDKKTDEPGVKTETAVTHPAPIAPSQLPPTVAQPIPPVQPVQPAQITVNGRPIDQT
jgi:sec-independent protein translocase protein TatA